MQQGDPSTLKPGQFTLSLVHQPVGKYAACHSHEVVEHFLVLQGVLTVGWAWGDEVIEARLGPKDMVLNQVSRPHGLRPEVLARTGAAQISGPALPRRRDLQPPCRLLPWPAAAHVGAPFSRPPLAVRDHRPSELSELLSLPNALAGLLYRWTISPGDTCFPEYH
jgi:hypothetical protein